MKKWMQTNNLCTAVYSFEENMGYGIHNYNI